MRRGPPPRRRWTGLRCLRLAASTTPPNSKASPAAEAEKRNPAAVREATIASILDQANFVLGGVRLNAEIAQQFAGAGDQRGFLYALDQTVRHAIRAGAEGVELRKIRAKMREAASSNEGRPS